LHHRQTVKLLSTPSSPLKAKALKAADTRVERSVCGHLIRYGCSRCAGAYGGGSLCGVRRVFWGGGDAPEAIPDERVACLK